MRIISGFRDYYDCIQAIGQDSSVIYVRNSKEVKRPGTYPFPICRTGLPRSSITLEQFIIGFCGKIYPLLELMPGNVLCYSLDDVDAHIGRRCKREELAAYRDTRKSWLPYHRRKNFKAYFAKCAAAQDQFDSIFRANNSPVFVAHPYGRWSSWYSITFDAMLRDLEFFSVFDTHTAFQEIAMYVGGVLGTPTKPIPDVSDKDLISAKGFDKFSFRRPPRSGL